MRAIRLVVVCLPLLAGCVAPIQVARLSDQRIEKGAGITVQVSQPDPAGLEHALSRYLRETGFDVHSASVLVGLDHALSQQLRQAGSEAREDRGTQGLSLLQTPYLCRVRTTGWGIRIQSFTLQMIHVKTGRILLSMSSSDFGSPTPEEIAQTLVRELRASGDL